MTETQECQVLIYKRELNEDFTLWAMPFQATEEVWELVNTEHPDTGGMTIRGLTMETYLDACRKFTIYPEEFIQEIGRECELIPLTITYTY